MHTFVTWIFKNIMSLSWKNSYQQICFQDNCRAATAKICQSALGKADYQLGRTKVFLKDALRELHM